MFGLFKKKEMPKPELSSSLQMDLRSAVAPLLNLYESFSGEVAASYDGSDHNPAELRFFTMAATSVFTQAFGGLPDRKAQALVDIFYEQSVASLLLHMPRADFSLVHAAAIQRFGTYADLIISVIKADASGALEAANQSLITALDENLKVDRRAFDRSLAGMSICPALVNHAVQVKNAVNGA